MTNSNPGFGRSLVGIAVALLLVALTTPTVPAQTQQSTWLQIISTEYVDLDGDGDRFPDTGETGRVTITVRNDRFEALTNLHFILTSSDPDVACVIDGSLTVPSLAQGEILTLGSLDPASPGLTFRASDTLQSGNPADPAKIDLCLRVLADQFTVPPYLLCFGLPADLDAPSGATQEFTLGPDGLPGTADDGLTIENFDINRDGDGEFTLDDTFREPIAPDTYAGTCSNAPAQLCQSEVDCPPGPPDPICYSGAYIRGSDTGQALNTIAAVACGGYSTPPDNPACILDPDYPMDWHLHCPPGTEFDTCRNRLRPGCVGGCSYATPQDGAKAISLPNSLHMGAHFDPTYSDRGTTTHFRTVQGYMSGPLNLSPVPRPGDLELSFKQIVRLMDNNGVTVGERQCADCAQVQIQVDRDPDPAVDAWGFWDTLAPFQNVYDKKPVAWSTNSTYYCEFTPTDTGAEPPNPRGVHETMCFPGHEVFPGNAWASCGHPYGNDPTATGDCAGPGLVDPSGSGVWVESRFDLVGYLGQRVRVRWLGTTWFFDGAHSSYYEIGPGWDTSQSDEGWWIDDIGIIGTLRDPVSLLLDGAAPPISTCPQGGCADGDADGFGSPGDPSCPLGGDPDCDDADPLVSPAGIETCNGVDDDCDTLIDEIGGEEDSDGDGLAEACDNCPADPNPQQADGDHDHVGDLCDNCPAYPNGDQSDIDGDGHGDSCDNCPVDPNPQQVNRDGDGAGDVCDNCPLDDNPGQDDDDADNVGNTCDNCPTIFNPGQDDCDMDGVGDACEICPCGPCDQSVVDLVATKSGVTGMSNGLVVWRTNAEENLIGFNLLIESPGSGDLQRENPLPIPCLECATGRGASYSYPLAKHKSLKGIYIEQVRSNGQRVLYGPAERQ